MDLDQTAVETYNFSTRSYSIVELAVHSVLLRCARLNVSYRSGKRNVNYKI